MPHSFSNCPLRSSSLLITNHSTQSIVTANDEVLDLLGYSMTDLLGHSIHSLNFQLSSQLSSIPECTIKHANGQVLDFQVCVHQDPLGGSSCLDYWLIRRLSTNTSNNKIILSPPAISLLRLSPYGTIEQVQPAPSFKQPVSELIGRPVMAFVYQDDVEPLCASLAKICSIHKHHPPQDPLFIRWSRLPCLISTHDYEESLNYDWMSFTLMSNSIGVVGNSIRPICILRPLQVEDDDEICEESLVIHVSLFGQILDYCKFICGNMIQVVEESANHSKIYITEFYHHVVSSLIEMISAYIYSQYSSNHHSNSIQVDNGSHIFNVPVARQPSPSATTTPTTSPVLLLKKEDIHKNAPTAGGYIWDLIKSNYIMQRSLGILEFTGLLEQQPHFKSYMETLAT